MDALNYIQIQILKYKGGDHICQNVHQILFVQDPEPTTGDKL